MGKDEDFVHRMCCFVGLRPHPPRAVGGVAMTLYGDFVRTETQNVLPLGKPPQVKDNILMIENFYPIA